MKQPTAYLGFILDTLKAIRDNMPPDREAFMADRNAQDATIMRLQDVGEQLARIRDNFPDFYEEHHTDEWYKLIGLRNIISHGYREIDFEIIWEVVEHGLASFTDQLTQLLDELR